MDGMPQLPDVCTPKLPPDHSVEIIRSLAMNSETKGCDFELLQRTLAPAFANCTQHLGASLPRQWVLSFLSLFYFFLA
jgi:hypothetical protein